MKLFLSCLRLRYVGLLLTLLTLHTTNKANAQVIPWKVDFYDGQEIVEHRLRGTDYFNAILFNWPEGEHPEFVNNSLFSFVASNKVIAPETGTYRLVLITNDKVKLFIVNNGISVPIFNSVIAPRPDGFYWVDVNMDAGEEYEYRLEWTNIDPDDSRVELSWKKPSADSREVMISQNFLSTIKMMDDTRSLSPNGELNGTIYPLSVIENWDLVKDGVESAVLSKNTGWRCEDVGENIIDVTLIDNYGNQRVNQTTINIRDNTAPEFYQQISDRNVYLDETGVAELDTTFIFALAYDACGMSRDTDFSKTSFTATDLGFNTVTYRAYDLNGNSAGLNFNVKVKDTIPPTATPKNQTYTLDPVTNILTKYVSVFHNAGSKSDNATEQEDITVNFADGGNQKKFGCADIGTNQVPLIVTDGSGNTTTIYSTVTILEETPPIAMAQPMTLELDADGNATLNPQNLDHGSSDNCGITEYLASKTNFTGADLGDNAITFTVKDASGNEASVSTTVTVVDNIAPVAKTKNMTISLSQFGKKNIVAADVNDGSTDNVGIVAESLSFRKFDCTHLGENTITLTVTDESGNSHSADAIVTVVDDHAPELILNGDLEVNLNLGDGYTELGATTTDNCASTVTIAGDVVNVNQVGTYSVTYQAVDGSNNSSQVITRTVNVLDNVDPELFVSDIVVNNDPGVCGTMILNFGATATDNASTPTITFDISEGSLFNIGSTNVMATATDASGNQVQASFIVTVNDTEAPTISLNGDAIIQVDLGDLFADPGASSSDNCSSIVIVGGDVVDTNSVGTFTVIYQAIDPANNSSVELTRMVNVVDNVAPNVITKNITVSLNSGGTKKIQGVNVDDGSSDNSGDYTRKLDINTFDCNDLGANEITLTLTDPSGNQASANAIVTVVDDIAPTINLTGNVEITLDYGTVYAEQGATTTDNCSSTVTIGGDAVSTNQVGTYTVTYQATDASNNTSAQLTRTVNVVDNVAPVITAIDITVNNDQGICAATIASFNASATDNAGTPSLTFNIAEGTQFSVGSTTVTATAIDASGNQSEATFTVTVNDTEAPTISLTGAPTLNIEHGTVYTEQGATTTDNCSSTVTIGGDVVNTNQVGTYTVTYQATDISNNTSAQLTRTVNLVDNVAPVITATDITVNNDQGLCGATIATFNASATDNASTPSLTFDIAEGTQFSVGSTIVTATATDASGNQSEATFMVTVNDTEDPTINLTGDAIMTIDHGTVYTEQGATTSDNCSSTVVIGGDAVNTNQVGTYTVTFQATDVSNNTSAQLTRTVNVVDNVAPVITATDITVNNDQGICAATIASFNASATDNASTPSLTFDIAEGTQFSVGSTTVTATATDPSGNQSEATFTVTVNDTEAPTIKLTGDAIMTIDYGTVYTEQGATTTDNCSSTVTIGGDAVNTNQVGTYTVTYQAIDASNNTSAQLTRTVNVVDNVAPVITAIDITVNNDQGVCGATIVSFNASATDNAGTPSLTFNIAEGTQFSVGSTSVTATATDASGNQSEATFTVTVNDTEAPTINLTGDAIMTIDFGSTYTEQGAITTDNCSSTVTIGGDVVNTNQVGTYTVTYLATDASNNTSAQLIRTVNVVDNVAPVIAATDITVNNDQGICGATIASFNASATDKASTPSLTFDIAEGTVFNIGSTTVTATATDASGNQSETTFTVTVNDIEAPTITLTGDALMTINYGSVYTEQGATTTDNCSSTVTIGGDAVNTNQVGTYTVTYQATDVSNNSSAQLTRTVNVVDNVAPVITATDITVNNDQGICGATIASFNASATDNASTPSLTFDIAEGTQFSVGSTTVTATATDASGNQSEATFTVTVNDDEVPTLTGIPSDINLTADASSCAAVATWTVPSAEDNCEVSLTSSHQAGDIFPVGTTTVIYTAVDGSGNQLQNSFTITVNPTAVTLTLTGTDDAPDASIDALVEGGCAPYTYQWNTGQTTEDINNLAAGDYTLTVTDANGASATASLTIEVTCTVGAKIRMYPKRPVRKYGEKHTIYLGFGPQTVLLRANGSGGVPKYNYNWADNQSIQYTWKRYAWVSPKETTTYEVTVTDQEGCTVTETITVNVIDIRCDHKEKSNKRNRWNRRWKQPQKVHLCHKGETICLSTNAVYAHLRHGDSLGVCDNASLLPIVEQPATDELTIANNEFNLDASEAAPTTTLGASPNPVKDRTMISFSTTEAGPARVAVYNMQGVEVAKLFEGALEANRAYEVEFTTENIPSGILFVRVQTKGAVKTMKLLVQK